MKTRFLAFFLLICAFPAFSQKRLLLLDSTDPKYTSDEYNNKIDSLLIGQDKYQYAFQIRPSFDPELCLFYSPEKKEVVLRQASKNIWYAKEWIKVSEYRCPISQAFSEKLNSLLSAAVYSSSPNEKTFGLDGTTYEVRSNFGEDRASCWSPRGGNCSRLVDILEELSKSVINKDVDNVVGMIPEIEALTRIFDALPYWKDGFRPGVLIWSFDKEIEYPVGYQIQSDAQKFIYLEADGELGPPNNILLLPDFDIYRLFHSKVDLPLFWLEQQYSFKEWFSNTPSIPSSGPNLFEKRVEVYFDVIRVDASVIGNKRYTTLVNDYSYPDTDMNNVNFYIVKNLYKAEDWIKSAK